MHPDEWEKGYIDELVTHGNLTYGEAKDTFLSGMGCHDYMDDPKDAAIEELSLYPSDG